MWSDVGKVREVGVKTVGVIADGAMTSDVWGDNRMELGWSRNAFKDAISLSLREGSGVCDNKEKENTRFGTSGISPHTYQLPHK